MFDLNPYIDSKRRAIDAELDRRLPPATQEPIVLHEAMRYSMFPGGKRVRPILCLAAAEAASDGLTPVAQQAAMLAGLAVEVLHAYTLVHDDLPCMDDDDERRGKPTVHIAFGEANAVLVGDALQTLAFEWLAEAEPGDRFSPRALIAELSRAAGSRGVIGGQVADLAAVGATPSAEQINWIHARKTGDLFRAAIRMGAMAANADAPVLAALTTYAEQLGLAFQITDDLLDLSSGGGGVTELSTLAIHDAATARQLARDHLDAAVAALDACADHGRPPLIALAERIADRRE